MRSSVRAALIAAVVLTLALPGASRAAITVANTNDEGLGSLRQAIDDANPGESIIVPAGTYTLSSGGLSISKSLTISGHGAGDTIVRTPVPGGVLSVSGAGSVVTISGITIRDGNGVPRGAGVSNQDATLTLREVVVTDNVASADGEPGKFGGIASGGGIYNQSGALHLVNSVVRANRASAVGGSGKFGGITEGGGVASLGAITIEGSTIAGNTADSRGGQGPSNAEQFGGIALGGGLYADLNGVARVSATTISGNIADSSEGPGGFAGIPEGGGIFMLSVANSTDASLTGLTIAANEARGLGDLGVIQGGGIYFDGGADSTLAVNSTTLAGNTVDQDNGLGGNLLWKGTNIPTFRNTIIGGGIGPAGAENCSAKAASLGFNLESSNQCGFGAAGDLVNTDPQLGPLQDNGGRTATMALAATSPAVDRGSASGLAIDQRGVQRPIDFPQIPNSSAPGADGSDIGSFELQPSNDFSLGKLQRNRKRGTAILTVNLPLPDSGTLTLFGKGLKSKSKPVADTGIVKLAVVGRGKVKKALRRRGKRKVQINVTYSPTGNTAVTRSRKVKLVRKLKRSKRR